MAFRHPADSGDRGQSGRFAKLAELASNFTSSAAFSVLCVALVAGFVVVHLLHLSNEWQHLVGDSIGAVSLLLLALLKNSERRAEHAIQRKLDAIAAALLEQQEGKQGDAHEDLESAIRMEEL
ncbi:low affinity iron permease family protein [Streptomyces sp. NPDC059989]|uniref:low affinity iron permease family protein n=1 Tax=Streptomyces sp. NPDC059989 TaxID=3347026 RepID=UPI0036B77966